MDQDALTWDVDEIFEELVRGGAAPGISYGVVVDGELVHSAAIGSGRVLDPGAISVQLASRICSMTKSFVGVASLKVREEGGLSFDAPIGQYVPELAELRGPTADSAPIRVGSLMTMSTGLPSDDPWADRYMDLDREAVHAMFGRVASFSTAPGTMFEYSNLGWVMIGRALTNILGRPVQRFITERILAPLGMSATTWEVPEPSQRLFGHRWRDGRWYEEAEPLADGDWAPMAGLWSTVPDIARWMAFFMDAFPPRDDTDDGPLSRSGRREMQTVRQVAEPDDPPGAPRIAGYGYGLWVEHDDRLGRVVGHRGGLPGFGSHMRWLPDRGIGIVALANATYAPMHAATLAVLRRLDENGLLPTERAVGVSEALLGACETLTRLLDAWDDDIAAHAFSMNVALDEPLDRRREEAERLRNRLGTFTAGGVQARTATSGSFDLRGERDTCTVDVTLTPEVPPRIATYTVDFGGSHQ